MRRLRLLPAIVVMLAFLTLTPTGSATNTPVLCPTPAGYFVVARDSDAVIVATKGAERQVYPEIYRSCLLIPGGRFRELARAATRASGENILHVQLAGDYAAVTTEYGLPGTGAEPPGPGTVIVELGTGKRYGLGAYGEYNGHSESIECCTTVALLPTGAVAGFGFLPSQNELAPEEYILGFQPSYGREAQSNVIASAPLGQIRDLRLFQCAANCTSRLQPVIGWSSGGTSEFAFLPASPPDY